MKTLLTNYTFVPGLAGAGYITFNDYSISNPFKIENLESITNKNNGMYLFVSGNSNNLLDDGVNYYAQNSGVITSGNTLTFTIDTTMHSGSDKLQIYVEQSNATTEGGAVSIGNIQRRLRDGFTSPTLDTTVWTSTTASGDIINLEGNATGSRYLNIVKSIFNQGTESVVESKDSYTLPMRLNAMPSLNQRIVGQEFGIDFVGVNGSDTIEYNTTRPDVSINNIVISANVATVTCNTAHGLVGGDRIAIKGCQSTPLNVGPVYVTVIVSPTVFQCPITAASNTYNAVGSVEFLDSLDYVTNGTGFLFENATSTNVTLVSRNGASSRQLVNQNCATTGAVQGTTTSYSDAFQSSAVFEIVAGVEDLRLMSRTADGTNTASQFNRFTSPILDEQKRYKIRLRAKNLSQLTIPVARITAISKSGSTTATVTTDVPHGLTVNSFINIFGVLDQTNFANVPTPTQVASIISTTQFTIAFGASATATSSGGSVSICHGSVAQPGVLGQVVQSIARTTTVNDGTIYTVTCHTTVTGILPGEYYTIYGMTGTATQYEGVFKLMRNNGSILEFRGITNPTGADFTAITTGGAIVKNTQFRMHGISVLDYTRHITEIDTARGTVDQARALNVNIANTPGVTQHTGSNTTIWNAAGYGGFVVADIASAAITTNQTGSFVTPGIIGNVGCYAQQFVVEVTGITGAGAFMDVIIEESSNSGTNQYPIYHFERITANGCYFSPVIRSQGNRVRFIRQVGGSTPSVTCAASRIMWSHNGQIARQFFDRTIVPNTLNSVTPTYNINGCYQISAYINTGAVTATPATYQLEGSEDGTNYYNIGTATSAPANTTTVINVVDFIPKFVRCRVSTAGVGVTQNYVSIKAIGF